MTRADAFIGDNRNFQEALYDEVQYISPRLTIEFDLTMCATGPGAAREIRRRWTRRTTHGVQCADPHCHEKPVYQVKSSC